jgi:hypothetical protein
MEARNESTETFEKKLLSDDEKDLLFLLNRHIEGEELKGGLLENPSITIHFPVTLKDDYEEVLSSHNSNESLSNEARRERIKSLYEEAEAEIGIAPPSHCYLKDGDSYSPIFGSPKKIEPHTKEIPAGIPEKKPFILQFAYFPLMIAQEKAYFPIVARLEGYETTGPIKRLDFFNQVFQTYQIEFSGRIFGRLFFDPSKGPKQMPAAELTVVPSSTLVEPRDLLRYPSHPGMSYFERAFIGNGREKLPEVRKAALRSDFDILTDSFRSEEVHIALLFDTEELRVHSVVENSLFSKEPVFLQNECQRYLAETYGPGGLRHFLAIIDALDEYRAYQTGTFVWDLNEHLERIGAKKKVNGAYNSEDRKLALQIVNVFLSTKLVIYSKNKEKKLTLIPFHEEAILSEKRKVTRIKNPATNEFEDHFDYERTRIQIHSSDWYTSAFTSENGGSLQYTKFRRSLIQENHKNHAITLFLVPKLSREWRVNRGPVTRKVCTLLEWCNKHREKHKTRTLQLLEDELNYMVERGYLGSWELKHGTKPFSSVINYYEAVLVLHPPSELMKELLAINAKREKLLPSRPLQEKEPLITQKQFRLIVEGSGLSDGEFGKKVGLSRPRVNRIKNGKLQMTKELSERVRQAFPSLLSVT